MNVRCLTSAETSLQVCRRAGGHAAWTWRTGAALGAIVTETGIGLMKRSFKIRVRSAGSRNVSDFWSPAIGSNCGKQVRLGDFQPFARPQPGVAALKLSGLAITENHYLVAGVLQPAGLIIFDLHGGGEPRQLLWPPEVGFALRHVRAAGRWSVDSGSLPPLSLGTRPPLQSDSFGRTRNTSWPEPAEDFHPLAVRSPPSINAAPFRAAWHSTSPRHRLRLIRSRLKRCPTAPY